MKKAWLSLLALPLLCSCLQRAPLSSSQEATGVDSSKSESSSLETFSEQSVDPFDAEHLAPELYSTFPQRCLDKIASFSSYKAVTKGSTIADALGMQTTQPIDVDTIRGEIDYLRTVSNSGFVSSYHEAYFHGEDALWRNQESAAYASGTKDTYLATYGVDPFAPTLAGFTIDEGHVLSVSRQPSSEGYAFKVSFDVDLSTAAVKVQMKRLGGLKDYPIFDRIDVTVTVEKDYTPISIEVDTEYWATKTVLFDITSHCHQNYTVTFSQINEEIEVPNLETAKQMLGLD